MAMEVTGESRETIPFLTLGSSAFMSNKSDRSISFLLMLLFSSCTLTRLLEGGEFLRKELLGLLHAFTGLAGADDDFLFEPDEFGLRFEVRLLQLDLVETPGEYEDGLCRLDLGLFILLEVLLLKPLSKDFLAESKASFKSKLHCASLKSLVLT